MKIDLSKMCRELNCDECVFFDERRGEEVNYHFCILSNRKNKHIARLAKNSNDLKKYYSKEMCDKIMEFYINMKLMGKI